MRKILEKISGNKFQLNTIADPVELFTFILDILSENLNEDTHKSFYLELVDEYKCVKENNNQINNKYDKDNLIVGGDHIIYIIDLNNIKIKQQLKNKYEIFSICPISDKIFLTTGNEGTITQWKFEDGSISKQHEKEKLATEEVLCMKYLDNGKILLGDSKNLVIIE